MLRHKQTRLPHHKPLTARQARFAELYAASGKGGESAIKAGFSPNGAREAAYRLLNDPRFAHVQRAVQERMDEMSEKTKIDAELVRDEIYQALQVAKASVKPAVSSRTGKAIHDEEGNPVYKVDLQAWLRACELLGRLTSVNAFRDNVQMSYDDDLIARIQAGRDRLARQHEPRIIEGQWTEIKD